MKMITYKVTFVKQYKHVKTDIEYVGGRRTKYRRKNKCLKIMRKRREKQVPSARGAHGRPSSAYLLYQRVGSAEWDQRRRSLFLLFVHRTERLKALRRCPADIPLFGRLLVKGEDEYLPLLSH